MRDVVLNVDGKSVIAEVEEYDDGAFVIRPKGGPAGRHAELAMAYTEQTGDGWDDVCARVDEEVT